MLLVDKVKVNLNPSNIKRYRNIGYEGNVGDTIVVNISDLSIGSNSQIDVKCDICGVEKKITYNQLVKKDYLKKYCCVSCKRKKNLIEKYDVINVFQIDKIKEKIKEKCLEKYGVDNISKNEDIKEQKRKTSLKNFGVEYGLSSELIKNKSKKTLIDKYGVDNISKNEDIKIKKENTCLKNFGVKYISQSDEFKNSIKKNVLEFLKNKYGVLDYENDNYKFFCKKCNKEYFLNKRAYQTRRELNVECCTYCNPVGSFSISGEEKKLNEFIKSNYNRVVLKNKKIIPPFELDIYLPDLNLAFEFNGLYWHSELYKNNNYHLNKTEFAEKKGIRLIHIYEDDWLYKQDIVKSMILDLIGKTEKIKLEKFEIKEINDCNTVREFLNQNHLNGFIASQIKIGMFNENELLSLIIFECNKKDIIYNRYKMLRFCNKINLNIENGYNKIFQHFIDKYEPKEIISYSDRSWCRDDIYDNLDFRLNKKIKPDYYYIIDKQKKNKFLFKNKEHNHDSKKSLHYTMLDNGIYRIYNSGYKEYIWQKEHV